MADIEKMGIEKLSDTNYATWSIQMRSILVSKKLWAAVRDDPPAPAADAPADAPAPVHPDSEEALAIMCLYVGKQHLRMVAACPSARAAWEMLKDRHAASSLARQMSLRDELRRSRKGDAETVSQFVARVLELRGQLDDAGDKVDDKDIVNAIMGGLPSSYFQLITTLKYRGEELTVSALITALQQFEQDLRRLGGDGPPQRQAAKAYAADSSSGQSSGRTPQNRARKGKGGGSSSRKANMECHYCHKPGHFAHECRKKQRDEAKGGGDTPSSSANSSNPPAAAYTALPSAVSYGDEWLLDSGATEHMTGNIALLSDFTPANRTVHNYGSEVTATGVGNATVHTKEAPEGILLRGVLYVPGAPGNLLSTSKVDAGGGKIVQQRGSMRIMHGERTLAVATRGQDGLYRLPSSSSKSGAAAALYSKPVETAELWHRRFGHLGYESLAKLVASGMVTGIDLPASAFSDANAAVCEPCVLAKHHREPFPQSDSRSTKPMQLVHMDVCGPLQATSMGGSHYFATYLDDYSKLSVVQPIHRKSDVASITKEVLAQMERLSGHLVRTVRTDGGGEYLSNDLEDYFRDKGIRHQRTVRYTPQQNGAAERLNRTLMERVRAMLEDSKLGDALWAEAVVTANYIRNRSPAAGTAKTPWELFHGRKPDVSKLRAFGALAYAQVPDQLRRKLDPKAERGVMVGYATHTKGYRILMEDGAIIISRDVVFDEGEGQAPADLKPKQPSNSEPADDSTASGQEAVGEQQAEEAAAGDRPQPGGDGPQGSRYPVRARRQPTEWWRSSSAAQANLAAALDYKEPTSLEEAMASKHAAEWRAAMDEEIASLHAHGTWDLVELPSGAKTIPVRWVYKVKRDTSGRIERFKARLVAKGFMQREGVDFEEVYAPVGKHTSLRALLAVVAAEDLELHAMDIKTAFLNGVLEDNVYVDQPPGYHEGGSRMVAHLRRALYGLRQSPRAWHLRLKEELEGIGFQPSSADASLFTYQHKTGLVSMLAYVDDLLIAAHSMEAIDFVKQKVQAAFSTHDLGEAVAFLGMSIERDRAVRTIKLAQSNMVNELVAKYGLADAAPKGVPLSPTTQLTKGGSTPLDTSTHTYSALVGSLLYLSVCTRPDIAQAVGALAKYMAAPTEAHWTAAKGVLRYLKGTASLGITFGAGGTSSNSHTGGRSRAVVGYCDADYAGDLDTRRSTTGYVFLFNGGAISWNSRRQPTVAASTTEAEYMAEAAAAKEAIWLRTLLSDLGVAVPTTIKIMADNQSAIKVANNPVTSARSKHIDVVYHFVRERVAREEIEFEYVPTNKMVADALTKAVPEDKMVFCRDSMGVR